MYNMFIRIKLEALHDQLSFIHVLNLCDIMEECAFKYVTFSFLLPKMKLYVIMR